MSPSAGSMPSPIRRRTPEERAAYLDGFEAGVDAALREVAGLNFGDAAERARPKVTLLLALVKETDRV